MKLLGLLALLLVASVYADDEDDGLAKDCDPEVCVLPNCRCSSTNIPGGLSPRDTPQFVSVTFDDAVNVVNILDYRELLYNRKNKNGCPAGATFFVSHEYTNYQHVNELYNNGFEIALHSISHQTPPAYWAEATEEILEKEIGEQRILMSHFANIPFTSIKGVRMPFLQLAGDNSFKVMAKNNLLYDLSWPTVAHTNPGLWPYSLDYKSTHDCIIGPCPTASIPNVWVFPMVSWTDLAGFPCSMVDACFQPPADDDEEGWLRFILTNFERHYFGNRAPFGFYAHQPLISQEKPAIRRAFSRFLDIINNLDDVFMVNAEQVIDWVKNPVPVDEYKKQSCYHFVPSLCPQFSCGNLQSSHNPTNAYWMQTCNVCPATYPWVNNPLGQ
ncbi:uncharacterized protein LOC113499229 [Trichoplusia ni]|uniref:Uncharacterized protein LOC113499229 n=1 Tax=Trichoplusia ni TaxID=7111 RepID=A0A7E5W487_TRINI|nr:uncharacterized protein LOC113499229 [Trichoplusia ni]